MKGDKKVIEALNELLMGELTAINQYFLHSRMCDSWGYKKLGDFIKKESIEEMKHASELTDRILFLEGIPNFQKLEKLNIGENVKEQLNSDLELELRAIPRVKAGLESAIQAHDFVSRDLLEKILIDEERHVDWIEQQLFMIEEMGYENYLAQQM